MSGGKHDCWTAWLHMGFGIIAVFQLLGKKEHFLVICSQVWGYNRRLTPHCPRSEGSGAVGGVQGSLWALVLGSSLGCLIQAEWRPRPNGYCPRNRSGEWAWPSSYKCWPMPGASVLSCKTCLFPSGPIWKDPECPMKPESKSSHWKEVIPYQQALVSAELGLNPSWWLWSSVLTSLSLSF